MKILNYLIIVGFITLLPTHQLYNMEQKLDERHTNSNPGLFTRLYKAAFSAYSIAELSSFGLEAMRTQKYKDAADYFEKICSLPESDLISEKKIMAIACMQLGKFYYFGRGVEKSVEKLHMCLDRARTVAGCLGDSLKLCNSLFSIP